MHINQRGTFFGRKQRHKLTHRVRRNCPGVSEAQTRQVNTSGICHRLLGDRQLLRCRAIRNVAHVRLDILVSHDANQHGVSHPIDDINRNFVRGVSQQLGSIVVSIPAFVCHFEANSAAVARHSLHLCSDAVGWIDAAVDIVRGKNVFGFHNGILNWVAIAISVNHQIGSAALNLRNLSGVSNNRRSGREIARKT